MFFYNLNDSSDHGSSRADPPDPVDGFDPNGGSQGSGGTSGSDRAKVQLPGVGHHAVQALGLHQHR